MVVTTMGMALIEELPKYTRSAHLPPSHDRPLRPLRGRPAKILLNHPSNGSHERRENILRLLGGISPNGPVRKDAHAYGEGQPAQSRAYELRGRRPMNTREAIGR